MNEWFEKECSISEIEHLLNDEYEIEVDSPDGWVGVNFFVNKGMWEEYLLTTDKGNIVRCNENHLFETSEGWKYAKDMLKDDHWVNSKNGYCLCTVSKTEKKIPIVDINVNHENHRYYTNDISSHNTGVGKSLFMCHVAASCLSEGQNVLYITMEMAEEKIAERIDANLLNIDLDELHTISKENYTRKFSSLINKTQGKLIIKEYPTASASALHFRTLLNDLALKKSFRPDIIFIDYLNICCSSRIKPGANVNSYSYIKSIAEELRGLAVEYSLPILSATQTTRCLSLNTIVKLNGKYCEISEVKVGDNIESDNNDNKVTAVYRTGKKQAYRITLSDGKTIVCSENHVFPTKDGEKNILLGLKEGMYLRVKKQ